MATTPAVQIEAVPRPTLWSTLFSAIPKFWALTKPEVNFLIVIATFTGFYLGFSSNVNPFPFARLYSTLFGTLLVASGSGALNQCFEYRFDVRMRRTCRRPVATGRIHPAAAASFGLTLSLIGAVYLLVAVNGLTSVLAVFTLASYLFVYTPLKRKTPLCTLAGAVPGAMPPLIGWAAASGSLASGNGWLLCAVLFLWQFPHFMAIAWMYREDYARAGYLILPARDGDKFMVLLTAVPSILLLVTSIAAVAENSGGMFEMFATVILASGLLYYAGRQILFRSRSVARQLLKATIIYLPLQYLILVLGKTNYLSPRIRLENHSAPLTCLHQIPLGCSLAPSEETLTKSSLSWGTLSPVPFASFIR